MGLIFELKSSSLLQKEYKSETDIKCENLLRNFIYSHNSCSVGCQCLLVWNVRNDQGTVLEVLNLNNCSCRGCFFVCFFLNKYIDLNWLKIINARPSVDLSFFGLNSLPLTQLTEITIYFCQIIYLISAHINICIQLQNILQHINY